MKRHVILAAGLVAATGVLAAAPAAMAATAGQPGSARPQGTAPAGAVVNQAQASQASHGVVPLFTCSNFGMLQDNSYGAPARIRSGGYNTAVTLENGNQTNYCTESPIGSYYELAQYGTNNCLTYDTASGVMKEYTCQGRESQYWIVKSDHEFVSAYNDKCARHTTLTTPVFVEFATCPSESWTYLR